MCVSDFTCTLVRCICVYVLKHGYVRMYIINYLPLLADYSPDLDVSSLKELTMYVKLDDESI